MRVFAITSVLVATASAPAAPSRASLPPPETKCSSDADCAATNLVVAGEGTCCYACAYSFAGTKRWVRDFEAACPAYLEAQHRRCAGLRCIGGLLTTECSGGTCRIKTN